MRPSKCLVLRGLKAVCPDLPAERGLADCIASLRKGRVLCSGQKVLLILDQFEQWLFSRGETADLELVARDASSATAYVHGHRHGPR